LTGAGIDIESAKRKSFSTKQGWRIEQVRTAMSSSCPNDCALLAMVSAGWLIKNEFGWMGTLVSVGESPDVFEFERKQKAVGIFVGTLLQYGGHFWVVPTLRLVESIAVTA
jgi:hypothetical protein